MSDNKVEVIQKKTILDLFIDGARKGFTIGTTSLLPKCNDGICNYSYFRCYRSFTINWRCIPAVMGLWGLPGEAATVLITALMSMGGGVGVAMSLYTAGSLDAMQVTVLLPAIYLMGNPVQNVGRCLGIAGVSTKHYPAIILICVINALLSIWAMHFIMLFLQ